MIKNIKKLGKTVKNVENHQKYLITAKKASKISKNG